MRLILSTVTQLVFLLFLTLPLGIAQEEKRQHSKKTPQKKVSFVKDIRPIFEKRCMHCHNQKTMPDRISFEYAALAFSKDKHGKIYIVRGKPDQSLLIKAIESPDFHEKQMPMVGPRTTKEENAKFRQWVAEGAHWPRGKNGRVKVSWHAKE